MRLMRCALLTLTLLATFTATAAAADLTTAQKQALKANIAASADLIPAGITNCSGFVGVAVNAVPNTSDGNACLAQVYAVTQATFIVWKTKVTVTMVGDKINATELAGLTSLNIDRLQAIIMLSADGLNPSLADRRQFFDDVFSGAGGVNTRANLLALWKRSANRLEKLFATGTGSDASPATLVVEGTLTASQIEQARNS